MKAAIFALFLIYSLKISATDVDKRLQNEYRCCREKLKKELKEYRLDSILSGHRYFVCELYGCSRGDRYVVIPTSVGYDVYCIEPGFSEYKMKSYDKDTEELANLFTLPEKVVDCDRMHTDKETYLPFCFYCALFNSEDDVAFEWNLTTKCEKCEKNVNAVIGSFIGFVFLKERINTKK